MKEKRLVRPKSGRMLFGVAAGIANYFKIDPTIVRLIFVIITIWGGVGLVLYIVGIFFIPDEKDHGKVIEDRVEKVAAEIKEKFQARNRRLRGEQIFGIIILILGLIFLFNVFIPAFTFLHFWPLILIVIGLIILLSKKG